MINWIVFNHVIIKISILNKTILLMWLLLNNVEVECCSIVLVDVKCLIRVRFLKLLLCWNSPFLNLTTHNKRLNVKSWVKCLCSCLKWVLNISSISSMEKLLIWCIWIFLNLLKLRCNLSTLLFEVIRCRHYPMFLK